MSTADNCSVIKAFTLLQIVCRQPGCVTLGQMASEARLPVPTAHRLLRTLKLVGAVEPIKGGGYQLGEVLTSLGTQWVQARQEISDRLHTHVGELSRSLGFSGQIATLDDDRMVRVVTSSRLDGDTRDLGYGSFEAYCMGAGHVLLAGLPRNDLFDYLTSDPFVPLTESTLTEPDRLISRITRVAEQGFALEVGEFEQGYGSLSIPISDDSGRTVAALSVSGKTNNGRAPSLALLPELHRRAEMIAADMAGLPNGVRAILLIEKLGL